MGSQILIFNSGGAQIRRYISQRSACEKKLQGIWIFHSSFFT